MKRILLEVCVDDSAGLEAAVSGGADRIELCSALDLGGLTPSFGLIAAATEVHIPVFAMIRPRTGDFVYGSRDLDTMRRDIDAVQKAGLAGVVIGASRPDNSLDLSTLALLTRQASGLGMTLHRAVDLVPDPFEALEAAVSLGFDRILSSGGRARAIDGLETLAALCIAARGRIVVMPGSGINDETVPSIVAATATSEVHASCSSPIPSRNEKTVQFGFETAARRCTDRSKVARLRAVLNNLA